MRVVRSFNYENKNMSDQNKLVVSIQCFDCEPVQQLSWIIRNFLCNICEAYLKGSPRREQAYAISVGMIESAVANGSINADESNTLHEEIQKIEDQIYPGCSLL